MPDTVTPKAMPVLLVLAVLGLWATINGVETWAPDAHLRLPDEAAVLAQASRDAERLGCRLSSDPTLRISAGWRLSSTAGELQALVETTRDRGVRRRLLEQAPPLRVGVRYSEVVGPNAATGPLLLEYDGDSKLLGVSFGLNPQTLGTMPKGSLRHDFADLVARRLLGDSVQVTSSETMPEGRHWIYHRGPQPAEDSPVAYVHLATDGAWVGHRQPAPKLVRGAETLAFWTWPVASQLQFYVLVILAFGTLGLLFWRLNERRAGFNQLPVLAVILLAGLTPLLWHYNEGDFRILGALWLYLVLNQVGVILVWVVAEAELREMRPGAVESWDRLIRWKPLASTGRDLLVGLAGGAALAGYLSASGVLASLLGGGYGDMLVILPDYWSLPTALNWGLALAAMTALFVGCGGRLWGRAGALFGMVLATAGWSVVTPVAPLGWGFGFGLVASLFAGWIVWRFGLAALAVACVTALALPTAWVAWSVFPWMTMSAILSSLPLLLLPLGIALVHRAPEYGLPRAVAPAYVSDLEQRAKLQGEVSLLRNLQLSLLPVERPEVPDGVDLAWRMIPADTVGGDFLDVIEDTEGRLWLAVADAAGHGIGCSILTAFTKAAVAEHAVAGATVGDAMANIRRLFGRLRSNHRAMVTLLLAQWDPSRGQLSVVSAGHPPLLVYDGETVQELGHPALPLGNRLDCDDVQDSLVGLTQAVLVAYSDGVPEAKCPKGKPFTYERWPEILPTHAASPADRILDLLLDAVDGHREERPADDDVTAMVIKLETEGPNP